MLGLSQHRGPALVDSASGIRLDFSSLVDIATDAVSPMGVNKNMLVLLADTSVPTVVFYAGALLRGHAVALIDAAARPAVRHRTLERYRPRWVAGPAGLAAHLVDADFEVDSVFPAAEGELVRMATADNATVHPDLSVLLSTSGTTGSTKFVRLSHRSIETNAAAIAEYLELTPEERPITSLPLHYTFGLSVLNSHWTVGAPLVLTRHSMMRESFWDVFRAHECTSVAGVPFSYLMLERIGFRKMDLPTLGTMIQAGGALDQRLQDVYRRFMEDRGGRFFVMYGQTEATARISYVPPARLADKLGSAGVAIPGGQLSVSTDSGLSAVPNEIGEVIYEGPNVMMGYAERSEDLALGDEMGGVLRTGDIGRLDDDGYLFLTGRSKRVAKVYGLRINLDEVEALLRQHGPAAVIADGDQIVAFCAFGNGDALESIRLEMAREFGIAKAALVFELVDAVPTTTSDKVDYQQLQTWMNS